MRGLGRSTLALMLCLAASPAAADQRAALADYLDGARAAGLPVGFIEAAATKLTELAFTDVDGAVARYSSLLGFWTRIELDRSLEGAPGELADFATISVPGHATIAHEMWHCYLDTVARAGNTPFYQAFVARADQLYGDHPADRRAEIHDEAAAAVIERLFSTYLIWAASGRRKDPWQRETWRQAQNLRNLWDDHFASGQYRGYYGGPSGEVYVDVSLEPADILAIVDETMEGRLGPDFDLSFADDNLFADNAPPVPRCADLSATPGEQVVLEAGESFDPEGAPLSFRWTQTAGPTIFAEGASDSGVRGDPRLTFVAETLGQYRFALEVADDVRLSRAPLEVAVTVAEQTAPPLDAAPELAPDGGPSSSGADAATAPAAIDRSTSGCALGPSADPSGPLGLLLSLIATIGKRRRRRR